jgi:hypothetical protein
MEFFFLKQLIHFILKGFFFVASAAQKQSSSRSILILMDISFHSTTKSI